MPSGTFEVQLFTGRMKYFRFDFGRVFEESPLENDFTFSNDFVRRGQFAVGRIQNGLTQAVSNQRQPDFQRADARKCGSRGIDEIDLQPSRCKVFKQLLQQSRIVLIGVKNTVDQVDAEDAERFLLANIRAIPHVDVQDEVIRLAARF